MVLSLYPDRAGQIVQPNTLIWYKVKMSTRSVPTSDNEHVLECMGNQCSLSLKGLNI